MDRRRILNAIAQMIHDADAVDPLGGRTREEWWAHNLDGWIVDVSSAPDLSSYARFEGIVLNESEFGRAYEQAQSWGTHLLSASEAASRMGLSLREVQRLCKEGLLPALNVGGRYVIQAQDADAYTARPPHRPKKG